MALVLYKGDKNSGTDPISTASATIPTGRGTLGAFGFSSTSAPAQGQQGTNSSQTQPGDSMFGNQNQQNHPGGGGGGGGGLFGSSMGNGMNPPSNTGSSLLYV